MLAADDAAAAARRAGRRAGEYAHITQDMLKDGGYFDMPIQVTPRQTLHSGSVGRFCALQASRRMSCETGLTFTLQL